MPVRFSSYIKVLITVCLAISFCLVEADAQTRRRKRTRRATKPAVAKPVITNPSITPPESAEKPSTGDVKIISTADGTSEPTQPSEPVQPKKSKPENSGEEQEMQQTITKLSNQVDRLNDKLSEMQEDDRYHLDMERLTRAEQRAEQLRSQLIDTQSKIADFESKLEQIEYALKPENIERATQGFGSVRPEEARDARRRQLENERSRIRMQVKILENSKSRLEVASANADSEVDLLRAKLQQRRDQMDSAPPQKETPKRTRKP